MLLRKWEQLPPEMQNESVRKYYDILCKKKCSLFLKRLFDIVVSFLLLIIFAPLFLILAAVIKCDSKGPVFFRQERVTSYGRRFRIFKFRTMVANAEKLGTQVTVNEDCRVTKIGRVMRKLHLDETIQVLDILMGRMSFVGTRPEVPRYTDQYTDEMMATLLLPAGITSLASIVYQDERELINGYEDVDKIYTEKILPEKMKYNLYALEHFTLGFDIKIMLQTVYSVLNKNYRPVILRMESQQTSPRTGFSETNDEVRPVQNCE